MKLQIESVEFKNFLSFGSRATVVPFLPGVNLVSGIDLEKKKSNGAGKSSFLETVPFALFGQVHRNIKKEQIINWKNRRNCEVILNFKKGKSVFSVLRAIKPDNFEIYQDGSLIDKPSHIKEYQKTLNEIIGLNFQTFMSLIHSNINSSAKILSMKKPDKRKFMETMFGLSLYTKLNEKCNSKLKNLNDKIREIELGDLANYKIINSSEQRIREIQSKIRNIRIPEAELNEARNELKDLEQDSPNNSDELDSIRRQLGQIELEREQFNIIRDRINSVCVPFVKDKGNIKSRALRIYTEMKDDIEMLKSLEESYGTKEQVAKRFLDKSKEVDSFADEKFELIERKSEIHSRIAALRAENHLLLKKLDLIDNDICPTCGREFDDPDLYENTKNELTANDIDLRREEEKIQGLQINVDSLNDKTHESKKVRSALEKGMTHMNNLIARVGNVESEETIQKWALDITRYTKTLECLKKVSDEFRRKAHRRFGKEKLLQERSDDLKHHVDKTIETERRIKQLEHDVKLRAKMRQDFTEMIEKEKFSISQLERESKTFMLKKSKFIEIKDYLNFTKFICGDNEVKQHAISSIIPYMNKKTNFYLSEVDYGFYTILDKWLDAEIKGPGITNASYGSLSGGEGRGIDLAIQFAFLDVARLRAGIFPDYLTFDELLDSSIDGVGIAQLFKIIRTRQRDDNSKIFIISHRTELGNSDDIDNIYHVTKQNGYSQLEIRS
jgi:DNA repair exonuclease SbcCD ATPase subunit